jgi:hypothetical protein
MGRVGAPFQIWSSVRSKTCLLPHSTPTLPSGVYCGVRLRKGLRRRVEPCARPTEHGRDGVVAIGLAGEVVHTVDGERLCRRVPWTCRSA